MKRIKNSIQYKKSLLLKKYESVKVSQEFIDKYSEGDYSVDNMKVVHIEKMDRFINFYNKYDTKGIRVINGLDLYEESKEIYDKLIKGDIYLDYVFLDPDNTLRNIVMLLDIDLRGCRSLHLLRHL